MKKVFLILFVLLLFPIASKSATNTFYPTQILTVNPTGACIDGTLAMNKTNKTFWYCLGSVWNSGNSVASIGSVINGATSALALYADINGALSQAPNMYYVEQFAGSDAGAKMINCMNSVPIGAICNATGIPNNWTSANTITTTNPYGVTLILPRGNGTLGSGALILPWPGGTLLCSNGGLSTVAGYPCSVTSTNTDTVKGSTLLTFNMVGIRLTAPSGYYASNYPMAFSNWFYNNFVGGKGNVIPNYGCECYNFFMGNSFYATNSDGSGIGIDLAFNFNANTLVSNSWSAGSGGQGFRFGGYNLNIDGFTDEASVATSKSMEFISTAHDVQIRGCDLENHSQEGTGSTAFMPVIDSGATKIKFNCGYDVINNSDKTNIYGTLSSYPLQTYNPGSFLATQIATYNSGPSASLQTSYYASKPEARVPAATYFSGGSYTIAGWVYPTLAVNFLGSGGYSYQYLFNFGGATGLDTVGGGFQIVGGNLKPFLQVLQGNSSNIISDACTVTNQAWNYVMYSWDSGTGKATLSCNGSSTTGAQTIQAPNNVTRTANSLGGPYSYTDGQFIGSMAMWTIYNSALSLTDAGNLYTAGSSGSGYQATITTGTYGGIPIYFWPMDDAATSINISAAAPTATTNAYTSTAIPGVTIFTLTSVDANTGTYHGTITGGGSNAFASMYCNMGGFTNSVNNGQPFYIINSTSSTLTIDNPNSIAEVHAGTATCSLTDLSLIVAGFSNSGNNGFYTVSTSTSTLTTVASSTGVTESASATMKYASIMAESISGNNGAYAGPVKVGVVSSITGDTTGSGKAAQFGGDTLYTFYQTCNDWNGDNTGASAASYAAAFNPLTLSNYLSLGITAGAIGCKSYSIFQADTSHYLTKGSLSTCRLLTQQMPINDDGSWTSVNSPTCPLSATNTTGRIGTTVAAITLSGTTAGHLYWSNPINGTAYKKVVLNFQGYENTTGSGQTVTLPTAFSYTPATSGSCPSDSFAVSTTTVTLPYSMSGTFTGQCFAEGQ